MNKAVIGLGSNIEPDIHIPKARAAIAAAFTVLGESAFIQTKPVGYLQQDDFINGSVLIETPLDRRSCNQKLKEIEETLGRRQSPLRYGPRNIDLDLVIWNGTVIDPDFYERDFLRNAAMELLPDLKFSQ